MTTAQAERSRGNSPTPLGLNSSLVVISPSSRLPTFQHAGGLVFGSLATLVAQCAQEGTRRRPEARHVVVARGRL